MTEMKVHVLSTGVMETDLTWLLLKGGKTIRDRYHKNDPVVWGDCPTHAVLIEHPEGRVLWDTGVPRDWETRWEPTGFRISSPSVNRSTGPATSTPHWPISTSASTTSTFWCCRICTSTTRPTRNYSTRPRRRSLPARPSWRA